MASVLLNGRVQECDRDCMKPKTSITSPFTEEGCWCLKWGHAGIIPYFFHVRQCTEYLEVKEYSLCPQDSNSLVRTELCRQALKAQHHALKAVVFPVVMNGCESWTIMKAECWRIDAFELWCWRRFLRVPWTARRSNQSIVKEINPEYSLEGLMLKLKLQ